MTTRRSRTLSKAMWPTQRSNPLPRHVMKVGRNEPCPCGSGKKYKECHEREGSAYLEKLAEERARAEARERRKRLVEQGVPWYKRLFS